MACAHVCDPVWAVWRVSGAKEEKSMDIYKKKLEERIFFNEIIIINKQNIFKKKFNWKMEEKLFLVKS